MNDTLDLTAMRKAAEAACGLMKTLSNPDRLLLLCVLSEGESNVSELEATLGIVQPTLSQQLAVLREQGLVATRREGKSIYYSLASPQAMAVLQTLDEQFCRPPPKRSRR
ncbi:MAG TPA: metalloregulator ArsR/SmtB family transcription factor [Ramlibacter sp.]|nr:metalloregulator ArsR/SmtB family transcription factor [Ramlibacter sp.]